MIIAKIIDGEANITLDDLTKKIKENTIISECGAIFTFEGIVRGKDESKTTDKITLHSSDPEKTEKELEIILKMLKKHTE
jgi:molybdopterin synthase catalytic subunit